MKTIAELRAELGEIVAKLGAFKAQTSLQAEDYTSINELHANAEALKSEITAREQLDGIEAMTSAPVARATKPVAVKAPVATPEFATAGSFYNAVAMSFKGHTDDRLLQMNNSAVGSVGEDGGFLIPTDFRQDIQTAITGDKSLLSMTRQFKTGSNRLVIPVNETSAWDGSGIQAYWVEATGTVDETKPVFRLADIKLHKLMAIVKVSDELLEDAQALESYIKYEAPLAFTHKINNAIIDGDGVGKPLGFLRSNFKVKVAKETGQNADTIVMANVVNMHARILPQSLPNSVWICNPACLPQLRMMKFDEGANSPVPAYMPPAGLSVAPYGTLLGRPIMPMMGGVKALGNEGDLCLVDLNHYISAVKTAGLKSEVSTHVYFKTDETCFRFIIRIAGECPYSKPIKTENGDYEMSGIVTLADR